MKDTRYRVIATPTPLYIEINATDEDEAIEQAQRMLDYGECIAEREIADLGGFNMQVEEIEPENEESNEL